MKSCLDCHRRTEFSVWHFRLLTLLCALALLGLPACSPMAPAATPSPSPTLLPPLPTSTIPPPATFPPTFTAQPTATATLTLTPSLTPTITDTPTPRVPAIVQNGFDAWCVPGDSRHLGVLTASMPSDAGRYKQLKNGIQLTVPTGSCALAFTFNLPVPADAVFQIYDALDHLAFTLPLAVPQGQPNVGVATITQKLMLDPPYYALTFRMAVSAPGQGQLWTSPVTFARPIPEACFDPNSGILPDPVTGACPAADPREPELCRKPGSLSCHKKGVLTED